MGRDDSSVAQNAPQPRHGQGQTVSYDITIIQDVMQLSQQIRIC